MLPDTSNFIIRSPREKYNSENLMNFKSFSSQITLYQSERCSSECTLYLLSVFSFLTSTLEHGYHSVSALIQFHYHTITNQ
uniref:Ovule protein n=1 Tax=Ascaris lumbricoides TaxID=6252 RepID=A0A0M3ISG1_ASCLU